eukprot:scaffold296210_cov29-Tisochrysis_lutea.AAC.4
MPSRPRSRIRCARPQCYDANLEKDSRGRRSGVRRKRRAGGWKRDKHERSDSHHRTASLQGSSHHVCRLSMPHSCRRKGRRASRRTYPPHDLDLTLDLRGLPLEGWVARPTAARRDLLNRDELSRPAMPRAPNRCKVSLPDHLEHLVVVLEAVWLNLWREWWLRGRTAALGRRILSGARRVGAARDSCEQH